MIIMTISAIDGWTEEDTILLNRIQSNKVRILKNVFTLFYALKPFIIKIHVGISLFVVLQRLTGLSSPVILVMNKIDCAKSATLIEQLNKDDTVFSKRVLTCAISGQGIEELESVILELVGLDKVRKGGRRWTVNQVSG